MILPPYKHEIRRNIRTQGQPDQSASWGNMKMRGIDSIEWRNPR